MKKVLIATNSESGQANVCLAVSHTLVQLDPSVEIHFVTFKDIEKTVAAASEYAVQCSNGGRPFVFHSLDGPSMRDVLDATEPTFQFIAAMAKRPSFFNTLGVLSKVMRAMLPWRSGEFVPIYQSFVRTVDAVRPDLIVVDCLLSPALTACAAPLHDLPHVILSPNSLKDFAAAVQPRGAFFWKYPVMHSANPFPIPWHRIPHNAALAAAQIYYALTDRTAAATAREVKAALGVDVVTMQTLMMSPEKWGKILVGCRPEVDFPLSVLPRHITPCGPMVRPVPSVSEVDAELDAWLRRGPTVFVSLGTHLTLDEFEALQLAGALRMLLDTAGDAKSIGGVEGRLQVYWKLKKDPGRKAYSSEKGSKLYKVLAKEMEEDRVRIVDWVKPEPAAVLQTGTVVCSVNHGGANSFYDAVTVGVPQICLPAWIDCYDFGCRAELLGIGRWGNKQGMPRCTTDEFGNILVDVVLRQHSKYKANAEKLAALCAKSPGAEVAARNILDELLAVGKN
ncbi:hypothetical protein VTK56DRAFT_3651 [Thermocarpiscus australiensis]